MRTWFVILASAATWTFSACGTTQQAGICGDPSPAPTASGDADALVATGDAAYAKRADEASAREAISAWNQALAVAPTRTDVRVKLARANYYLADSILWLRFHIDGDAAAGKEMVKLYKAAADQAEMALGQDYPAFRSKYCAKQPFQAALEQLDKAAVPAIYWYAASLSRYALMTSLFEVLNQSDRIKAMMDLIHRLDPAFWYYASDRYLGGFYTKIPFPSGDIPKSRQYFERSLQGGPTYLATRVIFAEMNAVKAGDRALFQRLLQEVIDFDLSQAPEIAPENAAEQKKAKYYLGDIDNLIDEE